MKQWKGKSMPCPRYWYRYGICICSLLFYTISVRFIVLFPIRKPICSQWSAWWIYLCVSPFSSSSLFLVWSFGWPKSGNQMRTASNSEQHLLRHWVADLIYNFSSIKTWIICMSIPKPIFFFVNIGDVYIYKSNV